MLTEEYTQTLLCQYRCCRARVLVILSTSICANTRKYITFLFAEIIQNNAYDTRDGRAQTARVVPDISRKNFTNNNQTGVQHLNSGYQSAPQQQPMDRIRQTLAVESKINNNHLTSNGPRGGVINKQDQSRMDVTSRSHNTVQSQSDNASRIREHHTQNVAINSVQQHIRDEPVFSRARHSQNKIVADFATDLEGLDIISYDESPKRRRMPIGNNATHNRPQSGDLDDVFQDGGHPASEHDAAVKHQPMETSFTESRGNVTLDDILHNMSTISPSLDASMTSHSTRLRGSGSGSRRNASSTSSTHSVEPAHERLFRLLRDVNGNHHDKTMDSSMSKNSSTAGESPRMTSPREPLSPGGVSEPTKSSVAFDTSLDETADIDDNLVTVKCRNSKCKRQMNLANARHTYKTCHNCFTYYCSRECRQEHWEKHKKKCVFSRVSSNCKHVIKKVHDDSDVCEEFSKVARTGFIQKGRGCVVVTFTSLTSSDEFLAADGHAAVAALQFPLAFVSIKELEETQLFNDQLYELLDMCRTYNPEVKFVIDCVIISDEQQQQVRGSMSRRDGPVVKKCAKLRLTSAQLSPKPGLPQLEDNDTLILTAVPGSEFTENMEERKAREICFANIQRKLRQRGVRLRHQYPDVYNKLCAYVASKEEFAPMTLFPLDGNTGKRFMCLIMPNSEPEIEWMNKPDLLDELGLNTEL